MKKPMRLLPMLAAPALLGLAACQTSPDAGPAAPSLAFEQDAALRAASDSLGVPRPPREAACVVLRARLAELDTAAPNIHGLGLAVERVCELLPPRDAARVRPDSARRAARCDSLAALLAGADSVDPGHAARVHRKAGGCGEVPRPDTLRPRPPRPDTVPPPRPDSTLRAARCDSLTALWAAADSADRGYHGLAHRKAAACGERPPLPSPATRPDGARPQRPEDLPPGREE